MDNATLAVARRRTLLLVLPLTVSLAACQGGAPWLGSGGPLDETEEKAETPIYQEAVAFYHDAIDEIETLGPTKAGLQRATELEQTERPAYHRAVRRTEAEFLPGRFLERLWAYRDRARTKFGEATIAEIEGLPVAVSSRERIDAITEDRMPVLRGAPGDLAWDVRQAAIRRHRTIEARLDADPCTNLLVASGVPRRLHDAPVRVVHANAVQLRTTFRELTCDLAREGDPVTYFETGDREGPGLRLEHAGDQLELRFSRLPDDDAWVLDTTRINGQRRVLTSQDKIGLLRVLASR